MLFEAIVIKIIIIDKNATKINLFSRKFFFLSIDYKYVYFFVLNENPREHLNDYFCTFVNIYSYKHVFMY